MQQICFIRSHWQRSSSVVNKCHQKVLRKCCLLSPRLASLRWWEKVCSVHGDVMRLMLSGSVKVGCTLSLKGIRTIDVEDAQTSHIPPRRPMTIGKCLCSHRKGGISGFVLMSFLSPLSDKILIHMSIQMSLYIQPGYWLMWWKLLWYC